MAWGGDDESTFASARQTQSETHRNMVDSWGAPSEDRGGGNSTGYSNVFAIDEEDEDVYNDSPAPSRENDEQLNAYDLNTEEYGAQVDEIGSNPVSHDSTSKRKRRRKMFCIGVLMLLVGALVIGLTVAYTREKDDNKNNNVANASEQERGGVDDGAAGTRAPTVAKNPTVTPAPTTSDDFWDNILDTNGGDGTGGTDKGITEPTSDNTQTAPVTPPDSLSMAPTIKPVDPGVEQPVASPTIADSSTSATSAPTNSDGSTPTDANESGTGDQNEVENIVDETDPVSSAPTTLTPTAAPGNPTGSPVSSAPTAASPTNDEDRGIDNLNGDGDGSIGSPSVILGSPSRSPITNRPTTSQPSATPTVMPTVTPGNPTQSPVTNAPTLKPTTAQPILVETPTTDSGPTDSVETDSSFTFDGEEGSTASDGASDGVGNKAIDAPSARPTTTRPSNKPMLIPTVIPGNRTRSPVSSAPTTMEPSLAPVTPAPQQQPTNAAAVATPSTSAPSARPTTPRPTLNPTFMPTVTTRSPVSSAPTTMKPSLAPVTPAVQPDLSTTSAPSRQPIPNGVGPPTSAPVAGSIAVATPTTALFETQPTSSVPVPQLTEPATQPSAATPVATPTVAVGSPTVAQPTVAAPAPQPSIPANQPTTAAPMTTPTAGNPATTVPTAMPTWNSSTSWLYSVSYLSVSAGFFSNDIPERGRRATATRNIERRRNKKRRKAFSSAHWQGTALGNIGDKNVSVGNQAAIGNKAVGRAKDPAADASKRSNLKRIRK